MSRQPWLIVALALVFTLAGPSPFCVGPQAGLVHDAHAAGKKRNAKRPTPKAKAKSRASRPKAKAKASAPSKAPSRTRSTRHRHYSPPLTPTNADSMLAPAEADVPERAGPAPSRATRQRTQRLLPVQDAPLSAVEQRLGAALSLDVTPADPYKPWKVQLQNSGNEPLHIVSDVRLLWFEVTVPGKRKSVECRVPKELGPKEVYAEERVVLQPGEELSFNIDPRFYCFEAEDTSLLVPGSYLKPHYGWRTATQQRWRNGKSEALRLTQHAPFMALPADSPVEGLKEVEAPGIALGDQYAAWSKTRIVADDKQAAGASGAGPNGLELLMVRGADAASANDLAIGIAVRNRGLSKQRVHLRADQLTFLVWGPDGEMVCSPAEVFRAPDGQALTTLSPTERVNMTVRLGEFCPNGTFSRPGFYYISAQLPLLDNHDERGRALPRAAGSEQSMLQAAFARPLRLRSADGVFSYWDVAPVLSDVSDTDETAQAGSEHLANVHP